MAKAGDLERTDLSVFSYYHYHHHPHFDLRVVRKFSEIHSTSGSHCQSLGVRHATIRGNSVKTTIYTRFLIFEHLILPNESVRDGYLMKVRFLAIDKIGIWPPDPI